MVAKAAKFIRILFSFELDMKICIYVRRKSYFLMLAIFLHTGFYCYLKSSYLSSNAENIDPQALRSFVPSMYCAYTNVNSYEAITRFFVCHSFFCKSDYRKYTLPTTFLFLMPTTFIVFFPQRGLLCVATARSSTLKRHEGSNLSWLLLIT